MRIHDWLESLFDSRSKIRIIRLFFRYQGKEFTEREIADLIRMSPNTVNLALREIRKTNILLFRKIGRAHAFKLNQDSALYAHVRSIMEAEKSVEESMLSAIRRAVKGCLSCVVFGSFARGEEDFDSDLDLLVIVEDKESIRGALEKLRMEVSRSFSTEVSTVVLTPDELKRKKNERFLKEAAKEGIVVSGKRLEELYGEGG